MKTLTAVTAIALWGIIVAPSSRGQSAAARVDLSKLGPQIGERVPDFTLPDQNGVARTLESIMGARGAMLVFIRSADW